MADEYRPITIRIQPTRESAVYYDVETNLAPQIAETFIVDAYQKWVEFAMGRRSIGGRKLKKPTGRYAQSLKLVKRSNDFYEMFSTSPIADMIENGRRRFSLGTSMIRNGTMVRGKNGILYRRLALKNLPSSAGLPGAPASQRSPIQQNSNRSWGASLSRAEVTERNQARFENVTYRTISSKNRWKPIPEMPAYHPADYISKMLTQQLTKAERA